MSSLYLKNQIQVEDLIERYGYRGQIRLDRWLGISQFQWFNPEVFFLALVIYHQGIKTKATLNTRQYLSSLVNRQSELVDSIKGDEGSRVNIMVMLIRYLTLMIDYQNNRSLVHATQNQSRESIRNLLQDPDILRPYHEYIRNISDSSK